MSSKTLPELVALRDTITALEDQCKKVIESTQIVDAITNVSATVSDEQVRRSLATLTTIVGHYANELNISISTSINTMQQRILTQIAEVSAPFAQREMHEFEVTAAQVKSDRVLPVPDNVKDVLIGRIQLLADWHYPGLELGPHDISITKLLVGCDPLYLAGVHLSLINETMQQFSEQYQTRLRTYLTSISGSDPYLAALPQQQFGVVVSWNMFNYLPWAVVSQYITEVFELLRPGGTFLFGYNDADMVNGAKHVDWGGMAYMTKTMLLTLASKIGYEVSYTFNVDAGWHNISWLEIKKPGLLSTAKAHQVLGIIKDK